MTRTISMHRFVIGFAEGVIVGAAVFAALVNYASAAEFFATEKAVKAAAHGKHYAWICEGKDTLYYIGRRGEKHCSGRITERKTKNGRVSNAAPETQDNLRAGVVLRRDSDIRGAHDSGRHSDKQAVNVDADRRRSDACHSGICAAEFSRRTETALTTGVAAAGSMSSPWTEDFYPLLQGREEHAQFIPAVLIVTESKPIAATMMPVRLRSDWKTGAMHLLAGILAIIFVIGLGTFLVGEIQRLLRTREARR